MIRLEKWKVFLILLLTAMGVLYALPNVTPSMRNMSGWLPSKTVNLGLDLRGGSHLLLEADVDTVVAERLRSMMDTARLELTKQKITYTALTASENGISFKLDASAADRADATRIARRLEDKTDVTVDDDGTVRVVLSPAALNDIGTQTLDRSMEIVRRRIDESGTKEPLIQRQGSNRIVVQLPGVDNPEDIKKKMGTTGKLTFHLLDENSATGKPSFGALKLSMKDKPELSLSLSRRELLSGDMLVDAQPSFQEGAPVVSFRLNAIGAKKFCDVTRNNTGKPFAIVLDKKIISAPVINGAICGGGGVISGGFDVKEASDLSLLLRAGALPTQLKVVEERTVGPTLGADSVEAGKKACIMALLFVAILSCTVYGLFGLFASLALLINMVMIVSVMSVLQATLTLPGIAGIVLTIGLAVDANVLVYERIKEELRAGRSVLSAIDTGYLRARTTIIDSNVSALIAALILFSFGTGPIKGFAVTMCIGVATSYFCAIMLTRLMILSWIQWQKPKVLAA